VTSTIEVPTLTEPRRAKNGQYLIMPPGEDKLRRWSRVTTVAKTLDSMGSLGPWKAYMAMGGLMARPGLRARWEALMGQYGGDPWYGGAEDGKKAVKALIEECATAGGQDDRKEIGSALHEMTALIDVGQRLNNVSETHRADLRAYWRGLRERHIKVVPGMVEVSVVLDDFQIAGTFDRLVSAPGFGRPLVADLKCGGSLEYSWTSIATQLAAYSRANAIYRRGAADDGSQDERLPMPEVDQDYGLIMWLPQGEARLELWLVNLADGWLAFRHSLWVRGWRRARPQTPFAEAPFVDGGDLETLLEESIRLQREARGTANGAVVDLFPPTNKQGE
jgi:hypothetical protein